MTANTNYPDNITALYARLSQEDALDGESKHNQKKIRSNTQRTIIFQSHIFIDDGVFRHFDRPSVG